MDDKWTRLGVHDDDRRDCRAVLPRDTLISTGFWITTELEDREWTPKKLGKRSKRSVGKVDDAKPLFSSKDHKVRYRNPSVGELQVRERP